MTQTIKTNIKFYQGLGNVQEKLYGFVTKVNGSWRGCREDVVKKKIVFIDPSAAKDIVPNKLYRCSLTPMHNEGGFIVKSATLIKFRATISTACRKNIFNVKVSFGNKTLIYNPADKEHRKRDIQLIADKIRNQIELQDAHMVAEEFISSACMVKQLYNQYLSTKNHR